ncbi:MULTISPECIES: hypothetical protein [Bacteria]|uniref:Uncharacterized protein n=2 Tax=Bacteria TaxID=2 RepID=A0A1I4UJB8_9BURK|nr:MULTISPECIES: hypothetical protein [Bacteria]SFE69506.1 hypothetical protein SAMN05216506_113175 [Saccharopolyspora kobensis]SFM88850.1 hypothetical protein SAMN02982985_05672 [Rugamonas rubra]
MNLKDTAAMAAALRVLDERVKAARTAANADMLAAADPGDRITATHDGQALGSVSVTTGRTTARVTDPAAFAAWCAEHYPTEVEHRPVVRESFVRAVLDASKHAGQAAMPDGTLDVPGIDVAEGDPYVTVRLAPNAAEVVADMVRTGAIRLDGTRPAIEGAQQ